MIVAVANHDVEDEPPVWLLQIERTGSAIIKLAAAHYKSYFDLSPISNDNRQEFQTERRVPVRDYLEKPTTYFSVFTAASTSDPFADPEILKS